MNLCWIATGSDCADVFMLNMLRQQYGMVSSLF